MDNNQVRTSVSVPLDHFERLRDEAIRDDRSIASLIRLAIKRYLDAKKRKGTA